MFIKIARATMIATALIIGTAAVGGAQDLALVGGMLLDGYEGPVLHNAAIVIEGDRIVAVGPADQVEIPSNARVIDTRGMTMLPGLIDLHVHTMFLGHGEYSEWFPFFTPKKREMMEIAAKQLLMAGVTTAVDLGAPLEVVSLRDRIARGEVPGPRFHRLSYFRTTPGQIRKSRVAARQFIAANAVLGMGTDSGSPLNFHTESAWREISALVDSGMTPLQAISAATKTGAEIIGRGRELGTIEPGKLADVIVVRGNPLFDINALGYVEHVVKGGVVYR